MIAQVGIRFRIVRRLAELVLERDLAAEGALTYGATVPRTRIGAVAPNAVEAVVVVVEPIRTYRRRLHRSRSTSPLR
jgi:hypothetical protein